MAASIEVRLQRVLIELCESIELTPRERLEAAKQLAELKQHKPKPHVNKRKPISGSLLGN